MRTHKIVNKLRSKGKSAADILNILNSAYKSAKSSDQKWWNDSELKKSLEYQSAISGKHQA